MPYWVAMNLYVFDWPGARGHSTSCSVKSPSYYSSRLTSNTVGAIHRVRLPLSDAMPMHAGAVVLQVVLDRDNDSISPIGFYSRPRELPVDRIDWSRHTIGGER